MKYGKLRITWSVVCGLVALLLIAIWVGNSWHGDSVAAQNTELAFGRAQVEQVMRDRPDTAPVITSHKALRDFLETNFAGVATGHRVRWDNTPPINIEGGAECWSHQGELSAIRVSNDPSFSAIDKCSMMVFELHNAMSKSRGESLLQFAYSGLMSREDFARSSTHLEFQSGINTRDFFRQHPLVPFWRFSRDENQTYQTYLSYPDDFSEYLNWPKGSGGPYLMEYYGKWYDSVFGASKLRDATFAEVPLSYQFFKDDVQERAEDYFKPLMATPGDGAETAAELLKIL
jgi:hypothetical protein